MKWKDIGYEIQTKEHIEKLMKPNKSFYVELTTDTNVALDISGISLGGGESPVRFKFGLRKRVKRIMQWDEAFQILSMIPYRNLFYVPVKSVISVIYANICSFCYFVFIKRFGF